MRREARNSLIHLYSISAVVRRVGESASGVLVFPSIVKAGPDIGTQHGYGTLFANGKAIGFFKLVAAADRVPKGAKSFGYALFFVSDKDLAEFRRSGELNVGDGPNEVIMQGNEKPQEQPTASTSVDANSDQLITIAAPALTIVGHASQVTHRPAMNDQQEAAPRPNNLTLDPKYQGFIPILNVSGATTQSLKKLRKNVHAFAFTRNRLIAGLTLVAIKITPIRPD